MFQEFGPRPPQADRTSSETSFAAQTGARERKKKAPEKAQTLKFYVFRGTKGKTRLRRNLGRALRPRVWGEGRRPRKEAGEPLNVDLCSVDFVNPDLCCLRRGEGPASRKIEETLTVNRAPGQSARKVSWLSVG